MKVTNSIFIQYVYSFVIKEGLQRLWGLSISSTAPSSGMTLASVQGQQLPLLLAHLWCPLVCT